MGIETIQIQDYDYELPHTHIAQQALEPRDSSKLLCYKKGEITDGIFRNIATYLPADASLFYNDAKVIPARIFCQTTSGAAIEVFLLQPTLADYFTTLNTTSKCYWECLIGNKKKWKQDEVLFIQFNYQSTTATVELHWHNREENIVQLHWSAALKMVDILEYIGHMPLPPYIKRDADNFDKQRYQTVYSANSGSVAAPTAGLHFTESVMASIRAKGISLSALTLHVSAGTFLPVSADKAVDHTMHKEYFSISRELLHSLMASVQTIAVGTTSVRVLESLYWCAVKIKTGDAQPFIIEKLTPYNTYTNLTASEALNILEQYMVNHQLSNLVGCTSIMIMPGYDFKFVKGLITNFHQPKSTLILLIAAFIGNEWRHIYKHALSNNYRFLSYGDSSLLLK